MSSPLRERVTGSPRFCRAEARFPLPLLAMEISCDREQIRLDRFRFRFIWGVPRPNERLGRYLPVNRIAHRENARTLAAALGIAEIEAAELLNIHVAITFDPKHPLNAQMAKHIQCL